MEAEEAPKAFTELGKQIQMYMKLVGAYKAKVSTRPRAVFLTRQWPHCLVLRANKSLFLCCAFIHEAEGLCWQKEY